MGRVSLWKKCGVKNGQENRWSKWRSWWENIRNIYINLYNIKRGVDRKTWEIQYTWRFSWQTKTFKINNARFLANHVWLQKGIYGPKKTLATNGWPYHDQQQWHPTNKLGTLIGQNVDNQQQPTTTATMEEVVGQWPSAMRRATNWASQHDGLWGWNMLKPPQQIALHQCREELLSTFVDLHPENKCLVNPGDLSEAENDLVRFVVSTIHFSWDWGWKTQDVWKHKRHNKPDIGDVWYNTEATSSRLGWFISGFYHIDHDMHHYSHQCIQL